MGWIGCYLQASKMQEIDSLGKWMANAMGGTGAMSSVCLGSHSNMPHIKTGRRQD